MKIEIAIVIIDARLKCVHCIMNRDDLGFDYRDIPSDIDPAYPSVVMIVTEYDTEATICERALKIMDDRVMVR